jgi:divalent metal cation (Fe/Co/Zn/Cd) transporter
VVAMVGLGINAIWRLRWADPIAALMIVPLILREGREAMRGKACGCY